MLKGVMRVGILAKGLLLRGDTSVQLVVLCGEKPTRTLLDRVADALPQHLSTVAPNEKYEVQRVVEDAAIQVTHEAHTVTVTLTAPLMREQLLHADATGEAVKTTSSDGQLGRFLSSSPLGVLRVYHEHISSFFKVQQYLS